MQDGTSEQAGLTRPYVVALVNGDNPDQDLLTRASWHARECGGCLFIIAFCGGVSGAFLKFGFSSERTVRERVANFHPDGLLVAFDPSDPAIGASIMGNSISAVLMEATDKSAFGLDPLRTVRLRLVDLARSYGIPVITSGGGSGDVGLTWFLDDETQWPKALGLSALAVAICALFAGYLTQFLPTSSLAIVFVAAVVYSSTAFGLLPGLLTTGLSFLAFMVFFVPAGRDVTVGLAEGALVLAIFSIVSAVTSNLAGRLKDQTTGGRMRDRETSTLFMFTRDIATCPDDEMIPGVVLTHFMNLFGRNTELLIKEQIGWTVWPTDQDAELSDADIADEAEKSGEPATASFETPESDRWALPLRSPTGCFGVIVTDRPKTISQSLSRVSNSLCSLSALALERQQKNSEIAHARFLRKSEALRSALMSSMSHDLGTPLSSIIGATSSLLSFGDKFDPHVAQDMLETIMEEAERLDRFVKNIMQMTKIESGAVSLNLSWIAVDDLVHTTLESLQRRLADHDVFVDVEERLPLLNVDTVLLETVLTNLLENAVKYSASGSTISVKAHRIDDKIAIDVGDDGEGIAPEDLEAVFDKFYRIKSRDRIVAGTGLGLAICRGLVEAHGGTIQAMNLSPRGTRMRIQLPVIDVPEEAAEI